MRAGCCWGEIRDYTWGTKLDKNSVCVCVYEWVGGWIPLKFYWCQWFKSYSPSNLQGLTKDQLQDQSQNNYLGLVFCDFTTTQYFSCMWDLSSRLKINRDVYELEPSDFLESYLSHSFENFNWKMFINLWIDLQNARLKCKKCCKKRFKSLQITDSS